MKARRGQSGVDRREFIGLAGAVTTVSLAGLPLALNAAPPMPPIGAPTIEQAGRLEDWTIDDMWAVYPRPSEAIGFGRPLPVAEPAIDPVDLPFLV